MRTGPGAQLCSWSEGLVAVPNADRILAVVLTSSAASSSGSAVSSNSQAGRSNWMHPLPKVVIYTASEMDGPGVRVVKRLHGQILNPKIFSQNSKNIFFAWLFWPAIADTALATAGY